METTVTLHQGKEPIAVMKITGDINASNFMQITDKAEETFNNPSPYLIIDLSEVTEVSSAGLAALHKVALLYSGTPHNPQEYANPDFTHSSNARKFVKLLNPQPDVEKVLADAGLKLFFKIFRDLDTAIASF